MRQVQIQDPWAGLAYSSDRELISDLIARIQVLENRMRELETAVKTLAASEEAVPEPEQIAAVGR